MSVDSGFFIKGAPHIGPCPSSRWIGAGDAVTLIAGQVLANDFGAEGQAQAAITRRLGVSVAFTAAQWQARAEDKDDAKTRHGNGINGVPDLPSYVFTDGFRFAKRSASDAPANTYAEWSTGDFALVCEEWPSWEYRISLVGMRLDEVALRHSFNLPPIVETAPPALPVQNSGGRPPKWDWEGALAHVVALANTPDGLDTGPGAQAAIERIIASYFTRASNDASAPAVSEIRKRASRIVKAIESRKANIVKAA